MRRDQLLSDAETPQAFSQIFSLGATENKVLNVRSPETCCVEELLFHPLPVLSMLYSTVQQEYGIFGEVEKRSLTFVLTDAIVLKME